ncbi:MAG TPA: hypothetical protein VD971_06405 [Phycisphaerales bacterium]|nr:hypothetical protein [Phycisphaerales bacterium]
MIRINGSAARRAVAGALLGALLVCAPALGQGGDPVSQANALYSDIAADKRSDLVVLPLVAKMAPPPAAVATLEQARLITGSSKAWKEAEAWAAAPEQKAVIDAIRTVTQESDYRRAYAYGLPYGTEGVPPDLIRANLYADIGEPPTLSGAVHGHLEGLSRVEVLINVEAARRSEAGSPSDAIDLLTDFVFFSRQLADRQMLTEAVWGLRAMSRSLERIRDVAHTDFVGPKKLDVDRIRKQIDRLAADQAYLDLSRMRFPRADRLGTEQVIARVYTERGKVIPEKFAPTMARLGTAGRPLRLFSEGARWRGVADGQADWFEATQAAKGVYDEWARRWSLDWFDKQQGERSAYAKLDRQKLVAVALSTPDMGVLGHERVIATTEIVGTRAALGVVGFAITNRAFPPQLSSIRPRWMTRLDVDPYNAERANRNQPPLEYFVPMRDTPRDPKAGPQPYEMNVVATRADAGANFTMNLKDDTFVLYSRGSDNANNFARRVQNTPDIVQGADYLLWPPVLSLYRKNLIDVGAIE